MSKEIEQYLDEHPLLALELRYRYLEYLKEIENIQKEIENKRNSIDPYYRLNWRAEHINHYRPEWRAT